MESVEIRRSESDMFATRGGRIYVFLTPNTEEPFTTSDVIAECAGVQHHTVTRLIQQHEADFKEFGSLRFEIEVRKREVGATTAKKYKLNEQQATLLLTFLRNTSAVIKFKKELVRQFYAMREELMNVRATRAARKPIRLEMTDAIKALPDSPHKQLKYGQYTNLAYRMAVGKSARQIREERGADKNANASDYMTADELQAISAMENRVSVLLQVGMDYQQIKQLLEKNQRKEEVCHV